MPETTLIQCLELLAIGATAGVLGGLLGIGGGLVMIPAMVLVLGDYFGAGSFHLYKLAAITTSIVLSIPAAIRHNRAQAIVHRMLIGIVPLAIIGAIVGVLAARCFAGEYTHLLRRAFGGFLELVVLFNLYQTRRAAQGQQFLGSTCPMPQRHWLLGTVVGLPAGLVAGLLGIGGGVWAVPSQRLFLGVQLRNAIANSSCMIIGVAIATATAQSIAVTTMSLRAVDGWWLSAWLAPGALLGGWCGAGLTHSLPVHWVRRAFYLLLVVTGLRIMLY